MVLPPDAAAASSVLWMDDDNNLTHLPDDNDDPVSWSRTATPTNSGIHHHHHYNHPNLYDDWSYPHPNPNPNHPQLSHYPELTAAGAFDSSASSPSQQAFSLDPPPLPSHPFFPAALSLPVKPSFSSLLTPAPNPSSALYYASAANGGGGGSGVLSFEKNPGSMMFDQGFDIGSDFSMALNAELAPLLHDNSGCGSNPNLGVFGGSFGGLLGFEGFDGPPATAVDNAAHGNLVGSNAGLFMNARSTKVLRPLEVVPQMGDQPTLFQKRAAAALRSDKGGIDFEENNIGFQGQNGNTSENYIGNIGDEDDGGSADGLGLGYNSDERNMTESGKNNNGLSNSIGNNVESVDDGPNRRGKKKGMPAKNLMAERRRRKKLNDRLYMLRSVVPKISKVDSFTFDPLFPFHD